MNTRHYRPGLGVSPADTAGGVIETTAHDIFPTRIWQARLTELSPRFPDWIAAVLALRAAESVAAGRTNRNGWNSGDLAVLDGASFAELRAAILSLCDAALRETYGAPVSFGLQSWINIHDRGGFNFAHMHAGCLLSGCFYLQAPDGAGALMLRDPRPGAANGPAKGWGPNAYKDMRLQPESGLVVLFPHWLEHYVEVHTGEASRISIPFNAVAQVGAMLGGR